MGLAIGFILLFGITFIIMLLFTVPAIIGRWLVYQKAGKPGWTSIIPYYNNWVLFEISGVNPYFSLFIVGANILSLAGNFANSIMQYNGDYTIPMGILSLLFSLSSIGLSIVSVVFTVIACINLAKCFKKDPVYGVGLAFLGFIFFLILGLDKNAKYEKLETVK